MQTGSLLLAALLLELGYSLVIKGIRQSVPSGDVSTRDDHWRPQVHFSPKANFMNDPNGLFLDSEGTWHMYYQYADSCSSPDKKDWGHATSKDLYTWTDQPVAIENSPELGSIWSGSSWVDKDDVSGLFDKTGKDNVLAYYTSQGEKQSQFLMYSTNGGYSFTEYPKNPIIDVDSTGFRDPKVFYHKESEKYVMVVTLISNVTFYASDNLRDWEHISYWVPDTATMDKFKSPVIECPQLIPIPKLSADGEYQGSTFILMLSVGSGNPSGWGDVIYYTGDFDGQNFAPDSSSSMGRDFDFGTDAYATAFYSFQDAEYIDGRKTAISQSWATQVQYQGSTPTCDQYNWRHVMGGARTHWIDASSNNLIGIPFGVNQFRINDATIVDEQGVDGIASTYADVATFNPAIEFDLTVHLTDDAKDTFNVDLSFSDAKTGEAVVMTFEITAGNGPSARFTMDRSSVTWDGAREANVFSVDVSPLSDADYKQGKFHLYGILDRSILEVYLNGGAEFGTMIYFPKGVFDQVTVACDQGSGLAKVDFKAVPLQSSWGNPSPS